MAYRDLEYEKTPYINPLSCTWLKNNGLAKWVRTYFLSIDRPQYRYYEFVKQVIWIVLSAGLVGAYLKRRDTDDFNFLSLAVFGGLLFLTIFEGGEDLLPHPILTANFTSRFDRSSRIYQERKISKSSLLVWQRQKEVGQKCPASFFIQWICAKCGIMEGKNLLDSGEFPCSIHPGMKPSNPIFQKGIFTRSMTL